MPPLFAVSSKPDASAAFRTAHLYVLEQGASEFTELTLPPGVVTMDARAWWFVFRRQMFIGGIFNPTIVINQHREIYTIGLRRPLDKPVIAAGGGTGLTGGYLPYLSFLHRDTLTGAIFHESNLSAAGDKVTLANGNRLWSPLPTSSLDSRVNAKSGYISQGGGLPRRCWIRELSTPTVTESVSDNVLKNATPAPVDVTGKAQPLRGVPPYARGAIWWHRRAFYFGNPPYRLWHSEIDEPESVWELGYHDTDDGETIVTAVDYGDYLLVEGTRAAYALSGFGSDFRWGKVSNSVACMATHSPVNVQGVVFQASEQGVIDVSHLAPTGFRNAMAESYRDKFIEEYKANPLAFHNAQGYFHRGNGSYLLLLGELPAAPKTRIFRGYVRPMIERGEGEPYWGLWQQDRATTCLGEYSPAGALSPVMLMGDANGFVRKEDPTDDDDDGDTFQKEMIVTHGHVHVKGQVGHDADGASFTGVTVYAKNPNNELTFNAMGGDDDAASMRTPEGVRIRRSTETGRVDKTSEHKPLSKTAGKGVTGQMRVKKPLGVEYRGCDIEYEPVGPQSRPAK